MKNTKMPPAFTIDQTKPQRRSKSTARASKQPYKGITLIRTTGRYRATAWDWKAMKNINLGTYSLPAQAAHAYDSAIRALRREDIIVNFESEAEAMAAIRSGVLLELINRDQTLGSFSLLMKELEKDPCGRKKVTKMFHYWQQLVENTPEYLKTEFPVVLKPAAFVHSLNFNNQDADRKQEILAEVNKPDARIFWKLYREGLKSQNIL